MGEASSASPPHPAIWPDLLTMNVHSGQGHTGGHLLGGPRI